MNAIFALACVAALFLRHGSCAGDKGLARTEREQDHAPNVISLGTYSIQRFRNPTTEKIEDHIVLEASSPRDIVLGKPRNAYQVISTPAKEYCQMCGGKKCGEKEETSLLPEFLESQRTSATLPPEPGASADPKTPEEKEPQSTEHARNAKGNTSPKKEKKPKKNPSIFQKKKKTQYLSKDLEGVWI